MKKLILPSLLVLASFVSSSLASAKPGDVECYFSFKGFSKNESFTKTIASNDSGWFTLGEMLVQIQANPLEDETLNKLFTNVIIDIQNSNDDTFKLGFRTDALASDNIYAYASYRSVSTTSNQLEEYGVGCKRL
jgi:hypothetical protein